ncbi:hypothetical protein ACRALDRAFT_1091583, partial [Sodiomyces alcalophilus JCM 7366]|uniref:uncharacterized protein n=1 Tax=Sodiomyces alcalophilus JCM 7366 TaxID=591952 RepID=UPI0039B43F44
MSLGYDVVKQSSRKYVLAHNQPTIFNVVTEAQANKEWTGTGALCGKNGDKRESKAKESGSRGAGLRNTQGVPVPLSRSWNEKNFCHILQQLPAPRYCFEGGIRQRQGARGRTPLGFRPEFGPRWGFETSVYSKQEDARKTGEKGWDFSLLAGNRALDAGRSKIGSLNMYTFTYLCSTVWMVKWGGGMDPFVGTKRGQSAPLRVTRTHDLERLPPLTPITPAKFEKNGAASRSAIPANKIHSASAAPVDPFSWSRVFAFLPPPHSMRPFLFSSRRDAYITHAPYSDFLTPPTSVARGLLFFATGREHQTRSCRASPDNILRIRGVYDEYGVSSLCLLPCYHTLHVFHAPSPIQPTICPRIMLLFLKSLNPSVDGAMSPALVFCGHSVAPPMGTGVEGLTSPGIHAGFLVYPPSTTSIPSSPARIALNPTHPRACSTFLVLPPLSRQHIGQPITFRLDLEIKSPLVNLIIPTQYSHLFIVHCFSVQITSPLPSPQSSVSLASLEPTSTHRYLTVALSSVDFLPQPLHPKMPLEHSSCLLSLGPLTTYHDSSL